MGSQLPLGNPIPYLFHCHKINNGDEGSKGESAISLLVAVAQTRPALPVLACDSEINKAESEDERKHRKQSDE